MKNPAIGHINCHACDVDAEVKISPKSGLAYTFCPDCNMQSFCRNKSQHDKLLSKMRPVTVTEKTEPMDAIETDSETETLPPVSEKKSGFDLGGL